MTVEQITYKNIDPKVRTMIMFGLALAMLCACFDGTIMGTCGTKITYDLGGTDLFTWLVTMYLLCECVTIPIAGKLSDLYGRKPIFLIGLTIFVCGSIVAGMSQSMTMLIVCRAVQGLGGGILMPVATAAVADLYSPERRAKVQGILGAVFGVGSGIGPIIGGFLTENISWRWCFYINVPFAIAAYILTIKKFPAPEIENKPSIDYKGILFLTLFLSCLILIFELGGSEFAWVSVQTAALVLLLVVSGAIFVMIERKAIEPVLSPKLIKNKTVLAGGMYMLIFGVGMMGAMTFGGYFGSFILFELDTLTASYYTLFMVVGMMFTAMLSGNLCEKTGYRFWLIIGPIITFIGLVLLSMMSVNGVVAGGTNGYTILDKPISLYCVAQVVLGAGLGCMMTPIMAAVQNSSRESEIGMNTSAINLLRSIGTALGTAVFTMLINSQYVSKLGDISSQYSAIFGTEMSEKATGFITPMLTSLMAGFSDMANGILDAFISSVDFGFIAGGVVILCAMIFGLFVKTRKPEDE